MGSVDLLQLFLGLLLEPRIVGDPVRVPDVDQVLVRLFHLFDRGVGRQLKGLIAGSYVHWDFRRLFNLHEGRGTGAAYRTFLRRCILDGKSTDRADVIAVHIIRIFQGVEGLLVETCVDLLDRIGI